MEAMCVMTLRTYGSSLTWIMLQHIPRDHSFDCNLSRKGRGLTMLGKYTQGDHRDISRTGFLEPGNNGSQLSIHWTWHSAHPTDSHITRKHLFLVPEHFQIALKITRTLADTKCHFKRVMTYLQLTVKTKTHISCAVYNMNYQGFWQFGIMISSWQVGERENGLTLKISRGINTQIW